MAMLASSAGLVSTLAGTSVSNYTDGVGTVARFDGISDIGLGTATEAMRDTLVIVENGNQRIRTMSIATGEGVMAVMGGVAFVSRILLFSTSLHSYCVILNI